MPTPPKPPRPRVLHGEFLDPLAAPPVPREFGSRSVSPLPELAELDAPTQRLLADAIAKAVAEQLGRVRISSVPPPGEPAPSSEPPSSRIRTSIRAGAKATGKVGKWSVFASGVLSLTGTLIAVLFKPEYAAPLGQAVKLIAQVVMSALGGAPSTE